MRVPWLPVYGGYVAKFLIMSPRFLVPHAEVPVRFEIQKLPPPKNLAVERSPESGQALPALALEAVEKPAERGDKMVEGIVRDSRQWRLRITRMAICPL